MPTTIASTATDANALYAALAADLNVVLNLPALPAPTDLEIPDADPNLPVIVPVTVADLTTATVDGSGVFDVLMQAVNAQLVVHHSKGRLTGADLATAYVGSISAIMQYGVHFLLNKDKSVLENLQLAQMVRVAQLQAVKTAGEIQLVRAQIQIAYFQSAELQLKAYTARNQYASSKMDLVLGYNGILEAESKFKLTNAQFEVAHAQTHDNLPDGAVVTGVLGVEREMKGVQKLLIGEQHELARAQIRDTLSTGGAFAGLVAIQKLTAEAQRQLTNEQVDTQRAQTKDTLLAGGPIVGIAAKEKALKDAQSKLVLEQYESQRGQTRGTLSTGEVVVGTLGAQTNLYLQQITSYKRDAEAKGIKMILDTWIARKTIDEGVAVPDGIDTDVIDPMLAVYRTNLSL